MTESQFPPTPPPAPVEPIDYAGPQPPEPPLPVETDKDARTWAMLVHLSALGGGIVPMGHIILPLIIWQIKREYPFVNDAGKEAVNFNISVTIYMVIAAVLILAFIGIVLLPAIGIASVVLVIIAGLKANDGIAYRYPFTIRFIK
jgi:uncharacterized Tic20 family protein